jgi:hypothetical protein
MERDVRRLGLAVAFGLLLALTGGCFRSGTLGPPQPAGPVDDPKVAIVIIDGLRYVDGLGDPGRHLVPRMSELADSGALVEPFTNEGITLTWRAVPTIWTGAWTPVEIFYDESCGGENHRTTLPSAWEYLRKQQDRPATDAVYFTPGYDCPWRASRHEDYGPDYWPRHVNEGSTDRQVWSAARQVLESDAPTLFVLYLSDVDHAGHIDDHPGYETAISTADAIVGELWDFLQDDPDYAGKTTMLVTNDHGRHVEDWTGHGDACSGCRTVQLLATGPGIRPGLSEVPRRLQDIVPTVGRILDFETEHATGDVMEELLVQP